MLADSCLCTLYADHLQREAEHIKANHEADRAHITAGSGGRCTPEPEEERDVGAAVT